MITYSDPRGFPSGRGVARPGPERLACELGLGTRVRWNDDVVVVERIRLDPTQLTVSVATESGEVTFGWNDVVEVLVG